MLHQLSNQKDRSVYRRVAKAKAKIPLDDPAPERSNDRLAQGAVKAAILELMAEADGPTSTPTLLPLLAARFGRPIPRHTVNAFLSEYANDPRSPITRVGFGRYELDPSTSD